MSVPAPGQSEGCRPWDPLAASRGPDDPPLDVIMSGTVFFDLIFTGLPKQPGPGEEVHSAGMGSCPGGIANLATAAARLGLRTGLVAGFGDDTYADWMWETLARQEGIDLGSSRRFEGFHSAVTVSISSNDDRSMITHAHQLPASLVDAIRGAPRARAAVVDLAGETSWWPDLAATGTRIFADVGYDETGRWDAADLAPLRDCHAFAPNSVEAMNYTRTDTPERAVRALAELVPLAIVTDGARGSHAIDQDTGEEAFCPSIPVRASDLTGAGDVFAAASILGDLAGWPLQHRLQFAALCAGLAVQEFGGSLAAPGWGDIADWWNAVVRAADSGDLRALGLRQGYAFLAELIPRHPVHVVRRARATFALASDAGAT